MEELLRELSERMERIEANQQLILKRLNKSIIYPKLKENKPKPKNKKEEEIEELVNIIMKGSRIREPFNLAVTPQTDRIRALSKNRKSQYFKE